MEIDKSISRSAQRPSDRISTPLWVALALCLLGFVLHIDYYAFLCDDAYISFRYARNFGDGFGLIFNPGGEAVEGYSNFLWVVVLALGRVMGIAPDQIANPILTVCSLILVVLVILRCLRDLPARASAWWLLLPATLLASNRSFAVWSTSGLETRLFELLIVAGLLRAISELEAFEGSQRPSWPGAAVLLALATLTRPDGLLLSACILGVWAFWPLCWGGFQIRRVVMGAVVYAIPVIAHYLFRYFTYGDWLPNTYYVKVNDPWWEMGGIYFQAFVVEYALVLWLPFVAAGIWLLGRRRSPAAAMIPLTLIVHALYIARLGGDHFEYRPLDLYLPLLFILIFHGACGLASLRFPSALVAGAAGVGVLATALLPALSSTDAPDGYKPGFPGGMPREDGRAELIDSHAHPLLFSLPGVGDYLHHYNSLTKILTHHFIGLRREEHASFLATASLQGHWLAEAVKDGALPEDTHIAVCCVGAIPYYSDLKTLDRLGLTDRNVARQESASSKEDRMMAHEKVAGVRYAIKRGVDLWALDPVHLLLPADHPLLQIYGYMRTGYAAVADVGRGRWLLVRTINGPGALNRRFPKLHFESPKRFFNPNGVRPPEPDPHGSPGVYFGGSYRAQYNAFAAYLENMGDTTGRQIFTAMAGKSGPE